MAEPDYFVREVDYSCGSLSIYQATIGDVGHVVWDAALVLSKFLDTPYFTRNVSLNNKVVVELGSGTGIVGLAAALLGGNVYVTDLDELVPLMQKNIEENCNLKGTVKALPLKWGSSGKELKLDAPPDIILIADAVYYDEGLHPLLNTMRSLCGENTQIYLSYEVRNTPHKIKLLAQFFQTVKEYFVIDEIPLDVQHEEYKSDDIHIYKMMLK